jgi:uncharacterized LabA/DUF88 family protein
MRPPEKVASVFLGRKTVAKVGVYVDGFNIYYSLLKDLNACKWLSWQRLAAHMLPDDDILFVKYFTSRIAAKGPEDSAPRRQQVYIRALKADGTEVIEGKFKTYEAWHTCAKDPSHKHRIVKYEEKLTDTLIASEALIDAFEERAETFVFATNDSDFKPPMDKLRYLKKHVGVIFPQPDHQTRVNGDLKQSSDFQRPLKASHLQQCLLPWTIHDRSGKEIHCPREWR